MIIKQDEGFGTSLEKNGEEKSKLKMEKKNKEQCIGEITACPLSTQASV